jgi:hypothetical protein
MILAGAKGLKQALQVGILQAASRIRNIQFDGIALKSGAQGEHPCCQSVIAHRFQRVAN